MAKQHNEQYREKFRPDQSDLDREIDSALGDLSIDALYDKPAATGAAPAAPAKGATRVGRVTKVTKDDVFIDLGGKSQGVIPFVQFDEEEPKVGDEVEVVVDRYDAREGLLILNRKGALANNVSWENLEAGQIVEGTVTGTNKGGLELDVKGMRAFMPAGQVDIYHVPDLAQFVGQKVQAEVTQFDRNARNLVLSRRNILEREKEQQKEKLMTELAEGQIRRGTVRSVMDYGAFVDLGGVDGLLHVSELSYRRGQKATDLINVGDVVDVKVLRIDRETGKLSLSLKQARGIDPWADAATKYAPGTQLTGRVVKVESFGAFVEVEEGFEGLLPVSEMSWQRIRHPSDVVKEGDTLKLVVLTLDAAQRRASFSLKQAGPDPWSTVNERYAIDMVVNGTVTRTVDFGAFVELEPGLEGLIHVSELANTRVRTPGDVVKQGQEVRVRVLEVDKDARRMSLSLKRVYETTPAEGEKDAAAAAAPAKKKKRPELRGGLDFKY